MPKKKIENIRIMDESEITEKAIAPAPPTQAEAPLYTRKMWSEIKEVFRCEKCGTFRDTKDDIVLHILLHYPLKEQSEVFEKLMKESQ